MANHRVSTAFSSRRPPARGAFPEMLLNLDTAIGLEEAVNVGRQLRSYETTVTHRETGTFARCPSTAVSV
jgi:hypothetical protein